jgi:hypothetical protein
LAASITPEEATRQTLFERYNKGMRRAVGLTMSDGSQGGLRESFLASTSKFAAAKAVYANNMLRTLADEEEKKAALSMFDNWQRTEENTARSRARTGKQFAEYGTPERMELFPALRWIPSRSVEPRPEHERFYDRVWRKDDPFWATNQPGTLWNCKCDIEETDDDVTDNGDIAQPPVPKGLEGNPATTGEIFTDKVSYIAKLNKDDLHAANKMVFKDNLNWAKTHLKGTKVKNKEFDHEIELSNGGLKEYMDQPHEQFYIKNEMVRILPELIKNADYIGSTQWKGRNSQIFEIKIMGKSNWLIANVNSNGTFFHSITDSSKVLIGIKK